jgi:hypothetical protein
MATSVAAGEVVSAEVGFLPATFDEGVQWTIGGWRGLCA